METKQKQYITSNVLEKLVANKKIPMLFIGAGISKRYLKNYPSWEDLINLLAKDIGVSSDRLFAMQQQVTDSNPNAKKSEIYKEIGQNLTDILREQIITHKKNLSDYFNENEKELIIKNNIPFIKMLITHYFPETSIKKSKRLRNEIRELIKLEKNVGVVLTTNYDTFIDRHIFTNFKCFSEQYQYYRSDSEGIGEIYKIHGSISNPKSIIFNKKDYDNYNKNLRVVVAKILSLLLDYPIIFLGYSLEDENILEILTTLIDCLNNEQLNELENNFIYVSYKPNENKLKQYQKTITQNNKSIKLTVIETDNYFAIYKNLQRFKPSIPPSLVRKYKSIIRELVIDTTFGKQKIFIKEADIDKLKNDDNLVIAFGKYEELSQKGLEGLGVNDIVEMVLNQKKIDVQYAENIIEKCYINNSAIAFTHYVPIFYFTKLTEKFNKNNKLLRMKKRLLEYVKQLNTNKKIKSYNSIESLENYINKESKSYKIIPCVIKSYALGNFTYQEYIQILNNLVKLNLIDSNRTDFKKAITYADLK